ncbi:hypothetical protein B7L17_002045 [Burkholderia cenocepacia]|uniref:hypothetical protein n=1 Tax=Burkholderia cenocepacia TaxID=95486 RepID=UPI0022385E98|nr:hypothetical protein [Burkholderia cenocepacia]MCW5115581.1 hypothetical protein [Burkholderia cenocepacia]MCW5129035.1 hypothetical protein [Burkholderia cenocepacia]MCW5172041.1 hypothetical protein [Burkholderia cenocepacia]
MSLLHPDADLSLSPVVHGADILRLLAHQRAPLFVDRALELFLSLDKRRTPQNFFHALDLLFVVEAIDVTGYRIRRITNQSVTFPVGVNLDLFEGDNA